MGNAVTHLLVGSASAFHIPPVNAPEVITLPLFVLLVILAGLFGVAFNRSLIATLDFSARFAHWPQWLLAATIGGLVGTLAFWRPEWVGSGHALAESALEGRLALSVLPLLCLTRLVLTHGSYATGVAGGIFAPLLCLGALVGLACGLMCHQIFPGIEPSVFAVVGMAACFSAIVRAPLTGIVLIAEMTGDYNLLLPLFVASFVAYGIAELLGEPPLYENLLERSLLPDEGLRALPNAH